MKSYPKIQGKKLIELSNGIKVQYAENNLYAYTLPTNFKRKYLKDEDHL